MASVCISFQIPSVLTDAQTAFGNLVEAFAALSGEACNIFGLLGLGELETAIQNVLGAIGDIMGKINNFINDITSKLQGVIDTALGAINDMISQVTGLIDQLGGMITDAISQITGFLDQALGILGDLAGVNEMLACLGVLSKLAGFPPHITAKLDAVTALLAGGTPITDIAKTVMAGAINDLKNNVLGAMQGIVDNITGGINSVLGGITIGLSLAGTASCDPGNGTGGGTGGGSGSNDNYTGYANIYTEEGYYTT